MLGHCAGALDLCNHFASILPMANDEIANTLNYYGKRSVRDCTTDTRLSKN